MTHEEPGRNLYLRTTEPLKFVNTFAKNAEEAALKGISVRISLGGPEKFPTHVFEGRDIRFKKLLLFVDSMAYWTRMCVDAGGREDEVLRGLEGEVEPH